MESVVPAMATNGQPGLFPPWNVPPPYPVAQSTAAFPDERWGPKLFITLTVMVQKVRRPPRGAHIFSSWGPQLVLH